MKHNFTTKTEEDSRLVLTLAKLLDLADQRDCCEPVVFPSREKQPQRELSMDALCNAVHPEHPEVRCYHAAGHTFAHSGISALCGGYTWGMQHFNVVSEVHHGGRLYLMLDDGQPDCCYVATVGQADWRFELSGLHVGRTLDVWLLNVSLACGDFGSSHATWDAIYWADDGTVLNDAGFLDGYTDALKPIVKEMLQDLSD